MPSAVYLDADARAVFGVAHGTPARTRASAWGQESHIGRRRASTAWGWHEN